MPAWEGIAEGFCSYFLAIDGHQAGAVGDQELEGLIVGADHNVEMQAAVCVRMALQQRRKGAQQAFGGFALADKEVGARGPCLFLPALVQGEHQDLDLRPA